MAGKETKVVNDIMLAASQKGCTLWRNVRGMFYTQDKKRKVRAGLCAPGSADLIGFTRVMVTQNMVGSTVAIFTAIEAKSEKGIASPAQKDFVEFIREHGGIAGVAKKSDEAIFYIDSYPNKL